MRCAPSGRREGTSNVRFRSPDLRRADRADRADRARPARVTLALLPYARFHAQSLDLLRIVRCDY